MMMCGGFTPEANAATAEHQELADGVKAAVEAKTNQTFAMFKVINYKRLVLLLSFRCPLVNRSVETKMSARFFSTII